MNFAAVWLITGFTLGCGFAYMLGWFVVHKKMAAMVLAPGQRVTFTEGGFRLTGTFVRFTKNFSSYKIEAHIKCDDGTEWGVTSNELTLVPSTTQPEPQTYRG